MERSSLLYSRCGSKRLISSPYYLHTDTESSTHWHTPLGWAANSVPKWICLFFFSICLMTASPVLYFSHFIPSSTPFLLHWFISSDNSTADFTVNFWACLCDQIWSYRHLLYWELLVFWHLLNAVESVLCKMTRKLFRCVTEIKGVERTHWLCS